MSTSWDVVVVGGGAVGLAAAWYSARRGRSVLLLEQFELFAQRGSSAGHERQWRLQYAEEDLARLTLTVRPLWKELEEAGNRRLVHSTGSLWFGDVTESTNEGQITAAAEVLDRVGVAYEWLTAAEIERRFPFRNLPGAYAGFFQPDGGMFDVRGTLWVLADLARAEGAELRDHQQVLGLEPDGTGVTVRTATGDVRAGTVVVTPGPFANPLLEQLGVHLDLHLFELTSVSFRLRDPAADLPTWFAFQRATAEDTNLFYGFGRNPWSGSDLVRAGPDFEDAAVEDPYAARGRPDPRHVRRVAEWVRDHLPVLDPEPVRLSTGLAALPAESGRQFYLGPVPGAPRVVVHTSGWGFKFVPLLGRACVELALDGATTFGLDRLALPEPVRPATRGV